MHTIEDARLAHVLGGLVATNTAELKHTALFPCTCRGAVELAHDPLCEVRSGQGRLPAPPCHARRPAPPRTRPTPESARLVRARACTRARRAHYSNGRKSGDKGGLGGMNRCTRHCMLPIGRPGLPQLVGASALPEATGSDLERKHSPPPPPMAQVTSTATRL